jgi:dTDP-4-amino-4,6-dideoxygalactose transaminase
MHDLPALLGGPSVRSKGPPDWPFPDPNVHAALEQALRDGAWGKYDGGNVERLEQELADYHRVPFALTCASGTLAVEVALRALPVGPGDEVIVPAYDYEANFLCVHAAGATPVLADVASGNACLDPQHLQTGFGPRVKAILVSHLHGGMAPMAGIMEFAARHRLHVIEDAAQVPGAVLQGRKAGTWGDVGVLSFGGSKLLTAGRGGALLSSRPELHQRMRVLLRRGIQQFAALSELQAAVLRPQLAKLDERNSVRSENVRRLCEMLSGTPGVRPFTNVVSDSQPGYYKLGFWFDETAFGLPRSRFAAALRAEGVAFDEGFRAVHVSRSASRFRRGDSLVTAERAHHEVVILHHPVLLGGPDEIGQVARAVSKIYANSRRLNEW